MAIDVVDKMMLKVLETLNEAQARWYIAREAIRMGRGGLKRMHEISGLSSPTIMKGMRELRQGKRLDVTERIRRPGGGRKRLEQSDPQFAHALNKLMDESAGGDPMSHLRWTNKSTTNIAEELTRQGHPSSDETIRRRLRELGYTMQASVKVKEGPAAVGRDEQFRYINAQVKKFLARGEPILSVDTKKKEQVGDFKNPGTMWRPKGKPLAVNTSDYPNLGSGPAIPYGAYDVNRNEGFVNVGMTHDTAEFAVESLRRWWRMVGRRHYNAVRALLLCADGGGSNGSRNRAWKFYLQRLSDELGIQMTVCHYPPGTSKWNKIEHRMFSFISMNWRGQPLVSYETVVNLIGATRTKTGLRVKAKLDTSTYEAGVKIPDEAMERLNIQLHQVNPKWNYTISPRQVGHKN